jgi:hypothetical protein
MMQMAIKRHRESFEMQQGAFVPVVAVGVRQNCRIDVAPGIAAVAQANAEFGVARSARSKRNISTGGEELASSDCPRSVVVTRVRARDEITESKEKNPAAGRNAGKESGVYA